MTSWIERRAWGTTVSSCTSLSLSPPLILVCLGGTSVSTRAVMEQQSFGVSILRDSQGEVALRAAAAGKPKFLDDLVTEEVAMGSPVIKGALASVHCELNNALSLGDHMVVIGEVRAVEVGRPGDPLVYHRRTFRRLGSAV